MNDKLGTSLNPGDNHGNKRFARNSIGVLLSRFPLITETFILREIIELEKQGQPIRLVPLLRESSEVIHKEAKSWIKKALYTPFFSLEIFNANIYFLKKSPGTYIQLVIKTLWGSLRDPRLFLGTLVYYAKSVYLAKQLDSEGIRHLHAHFATHPTMTAYIISNLTGASFSFTTHAHDIFVHRAMLEEKLRKASFIRTISRFNKDYLLNLYPRINGEKFYVVHVGIDPEVYLAHAEKHGKKNEFIQGELNFFTVAGLKAYKGIPVLVETCKILKDKGVEFRCQIVGDGPLRDNIQNLINQKGLSEQVHLLGARCHDEVIELFNNCSMFILPSIIAPNGQMEGIPVALMEAMASKKPVITTSISGISELVDNGINGIQVEPNNPDALTRAILDLKQNPGKARQLAENAPSRILAEFSIKQCVANLLDIIDKYNPPVSEELEQLLKKSSYQGFKTKVIGLRKVYDRKDSMIMELMLSDGTTTENIIFKIHKSVKQELSSSVHRASNEYETLTRLEPMLSRNTINSREMDKTLFKVPRPLHLDKDIPAVIMAECQGVPLTDFIKQARANLFGNKRHALKNALHATGQWLRKFQDSTRVEENPGNLLHNLVTGIEKNLASLENRCFSSNEVNIIKKRLSVLTNRIDKDFLVTCGYHGDFWPGNVFIDWNTVSVIDFEGFRNGLSWEDPAYFLIHLEMYFSYPLIRRVYKLFASSFLDSYTNGSHIDSSLFELCLIAKALGLLSHHQEQPLRSPLQSWRYGNMLRSICIGRDRLIEQLYTGNTTN